MRTETEALPGIVPSGGTEIARELLLEQAQEASAFQTDRAERAETELAALADRLGKAVASAGAEWRERAELAEAEVERLRALLSEHEECLPPREAARRLGTSIRALRAMEKAGKLTARRTKGNHRRYPVSGVEALLRARQGATA